MKIKELKVGTVATLECIILEVKENGTRNNGTYVDVTVSDGESQISGKKWNTTAEEFGFTTGQVVFMEVKVEDYKGNQSCVIRDVIESNADPNLFVISAPVKAIVMYDFLVKTAEKCGVYGPVVKKIMEDNKEKLLYWGAARSVHHNISGGLLYHSYRMTKIAAYIASVYNKEPGMVPGVRVVNTELLVAGAILHDIGKLWELETNKLGVSESTPNGVMLGHIFMGAEVFGRYAREAGLKEEDVVLMQHLILAHHGKPEWGAAAVPATIEAMMLHQIDMIDSKAYQFEVATDTVEPGEITGVIRPLEQAVYRPTWRVPKDN